MAPSVVPDDQALVEALAGGDLGALRQLYDRHAPWLSVRLTRRCNDREVVADVLQDTFVAVWQERRTLPRRRRGRRLAVGHRDPPARQPAAHAPRRRADARPGLRRAASPAAGGRAPRGRGVRRPRPRPGRAVARAARRHPGHRARRPDHPGGGAAARHPAEHRQDAACTGPRRTCEPASSEGDRHEHALCCPTTCGRWVLGEPPTALAVDARSSSTSCMRRVPGAVPSAPPSIAADRPPAGPRGRSTSPSVWDRRPRRASRCRGRPVLERLLVRLGLPPGDAMLVAAAPALRGSWVCAVALAVAFAVGGGHARARTGGSVSLPHLAPLVPVLGGRRRLRPRGRTGAGAGERRALPARAARPAAHGRRARSPRCPSSSSGSSSSRSTAPGCGCCRPRLHRGGARPVELVRPVAAGRRGRRRLAHAARPPPARLARSSGGAAPPATSSSTSSCCVVGPPCSSLRARAPRHHRKDLAMTTTDPAHPRRHQALPLASPPSTTSTSTSAPASPACSAPTAPARPRCCASWPPCCAPTRARCACSAGTRATRHARTEVRRRLGYQPQELGFPRGFSAFAFVNYMAVLKEWTDRGARTAEVRRVLDLVGLGDVATKRISRPLRRPAPPGRPRPGPARHARAARPRRADHRPRPGAARLAARACSPTSRPRSTLVISTHQTEDVAALCNRVIVLDAGRVHFDGTVPELVSLAAGRVWMADQPDADRPRLLAHRLRPAPQRRRSTCRPAPSSSSPASRTPTCCSAAPERRRDRTATEVAS